MKILLAFCVIYVIEEEDTEQPIHLLTMKKSIILALALVAPAFGKGVETVVPVTVVEASAPTAWAVEVGANYHWAINDLDDVDTEGIDTVGADVTLLYNFSDNLAATLRFGWGAGEHDYYELDSELTSVTAGLRYTMEVAPGTRWYIGAEAGVANYKLTGVFYDEDWGVWTESDDKTGFAYGIETGVQYDVAEGVYVYGAVEFSGCTADPFGVKDQFGYGIRAGVGASF